MAKFRIVAPIIHYSGFEVEAETMEQAKQLLAQNLDKGENESQVNLITENIDKQPTSWPLKGRKDLDN